MADPGHFIRDEDRELFASELDSFIPDRVFDAHCHLWPPDQLRELLPDMPAAAGLQTYRTHMNDLLPGRELQSLFIPYPRDRATINAANAWIGAQTAPDPKNRGLFLIHPNDDPEWVRTEIRRFGLHGLKCYHSFAPTAPTWEAEIPAYLPESHMRVADAEGWPIMLHMVRARAAADESNLHWIRQYCETYPNTKLILAHAARGFQPAHNLEGLPRLAGLDNLYFDMSANCEPIAHLAVLKHFGNRRLLYGSDFCVSHLRGRCVGIGDSFVWLTDEHPVWKEKHQNVKPVLVGLESLRALKWACWASGMKDAQVEDIFWNNAAELFRVDKI